MDIDIKELEAFTTVVDKGSFSRAAEALFLTQPTISAHVAALERKLDMKLLVRTTKEVYLSDAGKLLYDYAQEILRLRTDAVQAVKRFSREVKGTVDIVLTEGCQYFLPERIRDFRKAYPEVCFRIEQVSAEEVAERVAFRRAELGVTCEKVDAPKCACEEMGEDRLVIITPNPPRYREGISFAQLAKEPLVFGKDTAEKLRQLGLDTEKLQVAVEVSTVESLKQMVSQGVGVSVLLSRACEDYVQAGKLLAFNLEKGQPEKICLLRGKNSVLSPAAQAFYQFVQTK